MKRNCHEAVELLGQQLRGSLSRADEPRLQAHLSRCEACQEVAADQAFVERVMSAYPPLPAVDTEAAVSAIRATIGTTEAGAARRRQRLFGLGIAMGAAAVGALIIVSAAFFRRDATTTPPSAPGRESPIAGATAQASVVPPPERGTRTAVASPEREPSVAHRSQAPARPRRRAVRPHPTSRPAEVAPQPSPTTSDDRDSAESPSEEPDLAEFFALGPPLPEPASPELIIETQEVIGADGSVMTVVAVTDVERGELIGHLVAPYDTVSNWQPLPPPGGRELQPGQPKGTEVPEDGDRTGNLTLGGGLG
jgi:hypothetical protein